MSAELYPGATEPTWFGDRKVYSVTGFVLGVRTRIIDLPAFWVVGEVSDFKHLAHLSMVYFTLKDPENGYTLRCTMGRTRFEALGITVDDGDRVQVMGRAEIYAKQGSFQLTVRTIEHEGRGLLMQQLEALKAKLAGEGLFDEERKRPLPYMPRRVGLITGSDAAAQGDFLRNVSERFPPVKIAMIETLVQGDRAAPQLVAALRKLEKIEDVDVIVITRGGGAFEHFLPFCDERLCRAIAACPKPVVSAIGHEKDNPISDFVADLRVSTPTAAARTVVPDYHQIITGLERTHGGIRRRGTERVRRESQTVVALRNRLTNRSPARVVADRRRFIAQLRLRSATTVRRRVGHATTTLQRDRKALNRCVVSRLETSRAVQRVAIEKLRALSPRNTLARGYSILRAAKDGRILRQPADLRDGERVTMTFAEASASATLHEVHSD